MMTVEAVARQFEAMFSRQTTRGEVLSLLSGKLQQALTRSFCNTFLSSDVESDGSEWMSKVLINGTI